MEMLAGVTIQLSITDMFSWIDHHNVAFVSYWDFQESSIQNGGNPQTANTVLANGVATFSEQSN